MGRQQGDKEIQAAKQPRSGLKRWWPLIALVIVVAALIVGELSFRWARHQGWTTYTTADGLAGNSVRSIAMAPDGTLWIATCTGVSRLDGETWTSFTADDGLAGNCVESIAVAPDGALWFGTRWSGVSRFDPLAKGEAWTTYTEEDGLASNQVSSIAVAPDGMVWAGTYGSGASRFDPVAKGEAWTTYTKDDGLASNYVYAIAAAQDSTLWFETPGGGVSRFDPLADGEAWTTDATADSLAYRHIETTARAPDGTLWSSADEGGVSHFVGGTRTTYLSTNSGLANSNVRALAIDSQGLVWMGTPDGLSILDEEASLSWQTLQTWTAVWGGLRTTGIIVPVVLLGIWIVRREIKARKVGLLPPARPVPAKLYLAGAALGALLLGPILGLATAVIGAPGFSMNTTGGGLWAWMSMVLVAPAGALIGALVGAFAVRKLHVLYLVGAVLGEVLFGIISALLGRLIGSLLSEPGWGSAGWTHGALVGALIGVIAGVLYARRRLAKLGKTTQDAASREVDRETANP